MSERDVGEMVDQLARRLIEEGHIDFSIRLTDTDQAYNVHIHECKDYEFLEYGEPYTPGEMFELGPAKPEAAIIHTELRFSSLQEAGDAVLKARAQIAGVPWGVA